jgi:hypothetical protein
MSPRKCKTNTIGNQIGLVITNAQNLVLLLIFTNFIPPHWRVGSATKLSAHLKSIVSKKHLVLFHMVASC